MNIMKFLLLGFISGAICGALYDLPQTGVQQIGIDFENSTLQNTTFSLLPGLVFGIFSSFELYKYTKPYLLSFYIFISTIAYIAAYFAAHFIVNHPLITGYNGIMPKFSIWNFLLPFLSGGFIGTLLLLLAFSIMIQKLQSQIFIRLLMIGTLISAAGCLFFFVGLISPLFIFWQTVMAGALGLTLNNRFMDQNNRSAKRAR